jgi:predicted histidine transporter YuiF (NhaC family)
MRLLALVCAVILAYVGTVAWNQGDDLLAWSFLVMAGVAVITFLRWEYLADE